ncbi:methylmalonyl-CoA mutase family protein, partial [Klebsiella michiganensis]|uniref:methylmalonyl-CoA mutase family protein n=1 Tax=Klebsiella michiganensis TaxID=1134687 RepID=UPI001D184B5B
ALNALTHAAQHGENLLAAAINAARVRATLGEISDALEAAFDRKSDPTEQRSMTIDEFLAMAGIPNTGSGEYVSAGTAESLPAV